jgi:hypothetical protein
MPKQDEKKATTKKAATKKAEKPAAAEKPAHRSAKPSNPFLVENPPPRMRGSRK